MSLLNYEQFLAKIDQLEEANILIAALKYRVFTYLGKRGLTSRTLAKKAGIKPEGAEALLNALVSLGALKSNGNTFLNTSESFKHFCEHSVEYKLGTVFLRKENRDEWSGLIDVLKHGRNLSEEDNDDPEFREPFTYAMHERSKFYSKSLAQFITRKPVGRLVDLGGGPGSYSAEILKNQKSAKAVLIDRHASLKVAKKILKKTTLINRFDFVAGDLFKVNFGNEMDTVLYSNILHIYNEDQNEILFKKVHKSLKPGGRFILVDLFLNSNRTEPQDAALFSLTMLLFTATGRTYTFEETKMLLKKNGFGKFSRCELGKGSSVIEAVKI
jgi:ubiquinone/menaquinone biosynthesis C-methylase UbiE